MPGALKISVGQHSDKGRKPVNQDFHGVLFPQEPLRLQSPLWAHPKVTITPHNAGDISPGVFAPQVMAQIERFERGLPLDNLIDPSRGY